MQNKQTIIIFTSEKKRLSAQALKDYFLEDKNILSIIIGEDEFIGIAAFIAKERIFREDGRINKKAVKIKERMAEKNIDKLPKLKTEFKSNVQTHKKMLNIITRYRPDLIILNGNGVLTEALAVRAKACPDTKIVMVIDDYTLNKQLVAPQIDRFFVANAQIKSAITQDGIEEKNITVVDLPCSPKHLLKNDSEEVCEKFNIDKSKKTVLFLAGLNDSEGIKYAVEEALPCKEDYNYIVYAGTDRALYNYCRENAVVATNEGVPLETLFSVSDILITRPIASHLSVGIQRALTIFELAPVNETEKRNAAAVEDMVVDISTSTTLVAYLSNGLSEDIFQEKADALEEFKQAHPYGILKHYINNLLKNA